MARSMILKGKQDDHEIVIARCECGFRDHEIEFSWWKEDEFDEIFICFNLLPRGFWMRVWNAILYVFKSNKILLSDIVIKRKEFKKLIDKCSQTHKGK
jgi:hypothetical protein